MSTHGRPKGSCSRLAGSHEVRRGAPMSGVRPSPPQRVPTLTEVVEFDLPPPAQPAPAAEPVMAPATAGVMATEEALQARILASLQRQIEAGFERFARLIEIVTTDEADRAAARARWKHYAARGYALNRHEVAA